MTIRLLPPADGLHNSILISGRTYSAPGAPPAAPSATAVGSGGTFAAGTYFWKVAALGPWGEGSPSSEVSATLVLNGSCNLAWGAGPAGTTGYKVFRGTTAGGENVFYLPGNVTSFTDTNAASSGGTPTTSFTVDVPDDDALVADANGWSMVARGVGPTSGRPTWSRDRSGWTFLDTTLGFIVIWDGLVWRNPLTGTVV